MLLLFSLMIIPALFFVLGFSHYQASNTLREQLDQALGRAKVGTADSLYQFFTPLYREALMLARLSALGPSASHARAITEVLQSTMSESDDLSSLAVRFEDGHSYTIEWVSPELRARQPTCPPEAWWIEEIYAPGEDAAAPTTIHAYYDAQMKLLTTESAASPLSFADQRTYEGARTAESVFVSPSRTSSASDLPSLSFSVPIRRGSSFLGAVVANIALRDISDYLQKSRISQNSESMLISQDGAIIAASGLALEPAAEPSQKETQASLNSLSQRALDFLQLTTQTEREDGAHSYTVNFDGDEYAVAEFPLENSLSLKERVVLITPTSDFIGGLQRSRRIFTGVLAFLIVAELLLIVRLARGLTATIKRFTGTISRIRGLDFWTEPTRARWKISIREISELGVGIDLLLSALRSFSLYVPFGVVRKLVDQREDIKPEVERRDLSILFCDLENFSTLAQSITSEELLGYTTAYFTVATDAITRHGGTVDKFIGDAVMAFWGAPDPAHDHATLACRAAVDITKGLRALNEDWARQGKSSLRVRIGINTASVLVGNIGSPDRLSYTAIGDGVNVASRLEGKNKELGTQICISDSTYEAAKDDILARPLQPVSVKGREGEFMVYELLDVTTEGTQELEAAQG